MNTPLLVDRHYFISAGMLALGLSTPPIYDLDLFAAEKQLPKLRHLRSSPDLPSVINGWDLGIYSYPLAIEAAQYPSGADAGGDCVGEVTSTSTEATVSRTAIPPSAGECVVSIRGAFSLQVKELAEVLKVQRVTIYSWIKDQTKGIHPENRTRLRKVCQLALEWKKRCDLPADDLIRTVEIEGKSMLDLLKQDEIDELAVLQRFPKLIELRLKQQRELDQRSPTALSFATKRGIDTRNFSEQQDIVDAFTGKRVSPE